VLPARFCASNATIVPLYEDAVIAVECLLGDRFRKQGLSMSRLKRPQIYEWFFKHVLQRLDSEQAHAIAVAFMRVWQRIPGVVALTDRLLRPPQELRVRALGMEFRSPLGVAAGVDKNATAFDALAALGFGAVEVGTATNRAQFGNDRPRVWRLPDDRALLNAMGFPNDGAEAQARRLASRRTKEPIGVNIGKSREVPDGDVVGDYRAATRWLAPYADYIALNVSSPNTPGLRSMQTIEELRALLGGVRCELADLKRNIPILIKLGPDLTNHEVGEIAAAARELEIDGIIAVNTTTDYEKTSACRAAIREHGDRGGLSGQPLKHRALEVLELLNEHADGLPLISVGGIENAEDAWQRILSGASLVQAHTGFVYGGPLWPRRLNRDLARLLAASPYATIQDAVGKHSDHLVGGQQNGNSAAGRSQIASRTTTPA
jgi:dihydroorotate dehydrogenase